MMLTLLQAEKMNQELEPDENTPWNEEERRKSYSNTGYDVIYARLESLQTEIGDLRSSVKELCDHVNKLAVIEERIAQHREATRDTIDRLRSDVRSLEAQKQKMTDRITELERNAASNLTTTNSTSRWIEIGITAVISGAGALWVSQVIA